ncbi:MAG TPA: sigma 54 modulation/S30EA ribosomal C-terminal domain-containing protein [Streptosporangiaceae bacterium]|nr:sigma 54 modulation/S30EA ribosomal C-terminal domain-containing protein [Streptosporangiaceae bacterium]
MSDSHAPGGRPRGSALQIETQAYGEVPEDAMDLAVLRLRSVLRSAPDPVLFARVKLAVSPGLVAGAVRSVVAQANIDLSGRLIRAQGVAENMRTAIELMCERLGVQLRNAGGGQGEFSLRRSGPGRSGAGRPGPGRSGTGPRVPRPRLAAEGAQVVRRKAFGLARLTVDEAIAELEAFDFDFHLFTERVTGSDSVVYTTVRGYRVAQVEPRPDLVVDAGGGAAAGGAGAGGAGAGGSAGEIVSVSEVPAPRLAVEEAQARLEGLEQPFIFFVEAESGRGNLLYFRYDGDLGLITPSDG